MASSTVQTRNNLDALVDIISSAVSVVTSEYASVNHPVPSLDSMVPGPFDTPEKTSLALANAVRTIEAACAQLSFTVGSPGHVIVNKSFKFYEPTCLLIVVNAKIADLLLDKPEGLHVDILAERSGVSSEKLSRILRMLATEHCFREVRPNVFANNRLSVKLLSTDPISALVGHMTDGVQKAASLLNFAVSDEKIRSSHLAEHAPLQLLHGRAAYDFQRLPELKKTSDQFAQAMIGWGQVTGDGIILKSYPWATLPADTTICDVGGGNGHITLKLLARYPHLKIILQDLPAVVDQGRELWEMELPEAVQNHRVEFVPLDFFGNLPVGGADYYYIRHVLHNWSYSDCVKILANVRQVMKPSSKLLIHEIILQVLVRDSTNLNQAPKPLLPNYGVGNARMYEQDINMMNVHNAKERTLDEFINMGNDVGLKFVKLWDAGETSLVEFSIA